MSTLEEILEHHGIKGMHWGVRRGRNAGGGPVPVTTSQKPGRRVKAEGGKKLSAHEDAINAAVAKQKARKSTTDALSDKELQLLVNRLNMEQNLSRLTASPGKKFLAAFLGTQGKQAANQAANDFRTKKVASALAKGA